MNSNKAYMVFAHRGDGRYHAQDAIGARYWLRENAAQKFADAQNACTHMMLVNPRGYVVRSSEWCSTDGVDFNAGRLNLRA